MLVTRSMTQPASFSHSIGLQLFCLCSRGFALLFRQLSIGRLVHQDHFVVVSLLAIHHVDSLPLAASFLSLSQTTIIDKTKAIRTILLRVLVIVAAQLLLV